MADYPIDRHCGRARPFRVALALVVTVVSWSMALPSWAAGPSGVAVTDDTDRQVTLDAPAKRIVSLAPHVTELLYAAGAGERIVGAVRYSDYPPPARAVPRVGDAQAVDLERVLSLEPDLVVAWKTGTAAGAVRRIRELGLPVFWSEPRSLGDIPRTLERFGTLAGTRAEARKASRAFEQRLAALRDRYADRSPVAVFYQIWDEPLMTVNGEHLISKVVRLCGGRNVFAEASNLTPHVSIEAVLARNPEVIVGSGADKHRPHWLDHWRRWEALAAVRRDNLFALPPGLIQRHTPRVLDGAQRLCRQLQKARERRTPQPAPSSDPALTQ